MPNTLLIKNIVLVIGAALVGISPLFSLANEQSLIRNSKSRLWLLEEIKSHLSEDKNVAFRNQLQNDNFVVQQLLNGDIEALGCVQHATSNMNAMMFFGANANSEEKRNSTNHFFNLQIMERFKGAAWPIFTDFVRTGSVENIIFETNYQNSIPDENRCHSLQALSEKKEREMTPQEHDDWIHCAKACDHVWKVIEEQERPVTESEQRLLKYCDRSTLGLISERAAMYRQIGGFLEVHFAEDECQFPGNGTISCGHRRDVNLGGLPVNGVDVLGKQEVSFTDSSFTRKYWLSLDFFIKDKNGHGTRRYPILLEYNVNESLLQPDGTSIESMDECQPLG